jgi:hypothetical protein
MNKSALDKAAALVAKIPGPVTPSKIRRVLLANGLRATPSVVASLMPKKKKSPPSKAKEKKVSNG